MLQHRHDLFGIASILRHCSKLHGSYIRWKVFSVQLFAQNDWSQGLPLEGNVLVPIIDLLLIDSYAQNIVHCGEHVYELHRVAIVLAFERRFWMGDEQRNPVPT